jgi:hypothetical protein
VSAIFRLTRIDRLTRSLAGRWMLGAGLASASLFAGSHQADAQDGKFARPPRFVPPVHAQPLRSENGAIPPARPLREVRHAAAVQDVDAPPQLHISQAGPFTDGAGNDEWRTRSTQNNSSFRQPVQETSRPAPDSWQTYGAPEASVHDLSLDETLNSQTPSNQGFSSRGIDDEQTGKSVLDRGRDFDRQGHPEDAGYPTGNVDQQWREGGVPSPAGLRQRPVNSQRNVRYQEQAPPQEGNSGQTPGKTAQKSCDEFRTELLNTPITDIVVDISPYPPLRRKDGNVKPTSETKTWTDCNGNVLGTGSLVGLERSYIVITTDTGSMQRIPMMNLSDGDLAVVTRVWALPAECSLGCIPFEGRCWSQNSVMWTASALCHKPLYFENVQLERYGHTHGPVMQPFYSTGHFFISLVTLPYHTAIHPANECVYALGYYRPGDCAPWLKDPIPFSLHGAARQAGYVVGTAAIIP